MRVVEPGPARGSLKWIRCAANQRSEVLNRHLRDGLGLHAGTPIEWVSPRAEDDFAEYRDMEFIELVGAKLPERALESFWPKRGPQWDALAKVGDNGVLLLEAKANIPEIVSSGTSAEGSRLALIEKSLAEVKTYLGVAADIAWSGKFYQYANRLAHLYFLREINRQDAYLAFAYFMGDSDVGGPSTVDEWRAALKVAKSVLGLPDEHRLSKYVAEVFIHVSDLKKSA